MNTQLTKIKLAARHYLRSLGMAGTTNEVANLMNRNTVQTILELAKKAGYALALLLSFASCIKEDISVPPTEQVVTYAISCKDCLAVIESSKWNSGNELDRSKSQYFNVTGSFRVSFTNTELDTARVVVSVSALYPVEQVVYINIWDNQGRSARIVDTLGYSADWSKNNPYELEAKLALR